MMCLNALIGKVIKSWDSFSIAMYEEALMKQEFKIIEVFDKEKPDIKVVLKDIFKSYIKDVINSNYDLKKSK